MTGRSRSLDAILVIGVVVGIGLGVLLVVLGQDKIISLLITLVITAITLLIDITSRLRETEKRIISRFRLGDSLADDVWLSHTLQDIINDYQTVKRQGLDIFSERMQVSLKDCARVLHRMADAKELLIDKWEADSFRVTGIKKVGKRLYAVQHDDPSYWRDDFGADYLKLNEEAVRRSVEIKRIWLFKREDLLKNRDIIVKQGSIVKTFIVELTEDTPRKLCVDFAVVDDEWVIRPLPGGREEVISTDDGFVQEALRNFKQLLDRAKPLENYTFHDMPIQPQ